MVNCRRERERKKGGRSKEKAHTKKRPSRFLLFQKEMDGVNEIGIS